jgi:metal-sulfur cluster biosynthetic enzyme
MTVDKARVLDALSGVRDPELDDPITELGFVSDLKVEGEAVNIRLRLPTTSAPRTSPT